jgi:hypothetical protein
MSVNKLGRGFEALPIGEQIQALRNHAIMQGALVYMLMVAVQKLGGTFTKGGAPIGEAEDADRARTRDGDKCIR